MARSARRAPPWRVLLVVLVAAQVALAHCHGGDVHEFSHEEEALTHQQLVERLATFGKTFARASAERLRGVQEPSSAVKEVLSRMSGPLTDEFRWGQSGTVARYIGVEQTNAITIPVTINIAFAGFGGDGGYALNVSLEDLRPWFEHVDHVLPHATVDADPGSGEYESETAVHYAYTYNVLELAPEVAAAHHALLRRTLRPVDPSGRSRETDQHADVRKIDAALGSLVSRLNLTRGAYALLVLNPRDPTGTRDRYGYRYGFSDAELEVLRGIQELRQMASQRAHDVLANRAAAAGPAARRAAAGNPVPLEEELVLAPSGPKPLPPAPAPKVDETEWRKAILEESRLWAADQAKTELLGDAAGGTGKPPKASAETLAASMLRGDPIMSDSQRPAARLEAEADVLYAARAIGGEAGQSCATDLWVSDRYAWVDLTAGPFEWGPDVGGEGVRSPASLPRAAAAHDDPELLLRRSKEASERLAGMGAAEAAGAKQERELLALFLHRFCQDERESAGRPLCGEIAARLAAAAPGEAAKGPERPGGQLLESISGPHSGEGSVPEALGGFLARLAAALSTFVRHVATPPSAGVPLPPAERLLFHLYVLAPHDRFDPLGPDGFDVEAFKAALLRVQLPHQNFLFALHRVKAADDPELWAAAAGALRSAALPALSPDGRFEARRRVYIDAAVLRDRLRPLSSRLHDDSKDPLTGAAGPHAHASAAEAARPKSREVPVFLVSLDHELPVLIDREHQAKALDDMVLVVQSPHPKYATGVSCDGRPVLADLRNPVRAAVMATLGLVGGIVPPNVAHSGALLRAVHDWTWTAGWGPGACVGAPPVGPLAFAPTGFQVDAAHRGAAAWALDRSLRLLNEGALALSSPDAVTSADNYAAAMALPLENASLAYVEATLAWSRILPAAERGDFAAASAELPALLAHAARFKALSEHIVGAMRPLACATPERARGPLAKWASQALVAAAVAAAAAAAGGVGFVCWWSLLRPARPKPKIN